MWKKEAESAAVETWHFPAQLEGSVICTSLKSTRISFSASREVEQEKRFSGTAPAVMEAPASMQAESNASDKALKDRFLI